MKLLIKEIIFTCLFFLSGGLLNSAFAENQTTINTTQSTYLKTNGEYVRARFLQRMKKPFTPVGKKKALIIGDSHAQDFFNGVLENNFLSHYQISTRYIPTRCQIYLNVDMAQFTKADDKALCATSDNLLHAKQQLSEADLIILVASWQEWAAKELPNTIRNMQLNPQQKLLVIGRKSFSKPTINNFKKLSTNELQNLRNKVDEHQLKINHIMEETLDESVFINLHQLVCGTSSSCPALSDDLKIISFDGGHFTQAGARFVTKVLFQNSQLGRL